MNRQKLFVAVGVNVDDNLLRNFLPAMPTA
jgi:hypothetical protein